MIRDGISELTKNGRPLLPNHFRIPKIEMLHNLEPSIRVLGSLVQFSTDITEHLHRLNAKIPFQHGNGTNAQRSMCRYLDRVEKVDNMNDYLDWREGTASVLSESPSDQDILCELNENPDLRVIEVNEAALKFHIPDLCPALATFYSQFDPLKPPKNFRRKNTPLPFKHLNVWFQL